MTKQAKIWATICCVAFAVLCCGWVLLLMQDAKATSGEVEAPASDTSHFDTSILESWCGAPRGTIRMIGGVYYEQGIIEDEDGNLWGWGGPIDKDGFYLLWLDDMGTPAVEDDEILKVWQEI